MDTEEINAFALPGGFMFLNRGLIEAADNEAELAGVMAHEMAHVALRHGTNQASKAYLAQAGFGILGGLLGNGGTGQIIEAIGGFGLNALFLKFSRSAETQADVLGTQILARAGYDPMAMVTFFNKLRNESGDRSGVEQFFSDHPSPGDRAERVQEEIRLIGGVDRRSPVGNFHQIQARLDRLPPAPDRKLAENRGRYPTGGNSPEVPSRRFDVFEAKSGLFRIAYPDNWVANPDPQGYGVTIVPRGGVVATGQGRQEIIEGVIINHYAPFEDRLRSRFQRPEDSSTILREATDDLVHQILRSNSYLEVSDDSWRRGTLDERSSLSVQLSGISPVTGEREEVKVFTRLLPDNHVIYTIFIAPSREFSELGTTFERMLSSLDVRDVGVTHGR